MKKLVQESIFDNIAGLQARNFIKKRLQHRCFFVTIAKFLGTTFFVNTFDDFFRTLDNYSIKF